MLVEEMKSIDRPMDCKQMNDPPLLDRRRRHIAVAGGCGVRKMRRNVTEQKDRQSQMPVIFSERTKEIACT